MNIEIVQAVVMNEGAGARVNRLFPLLGVRMNYDPFVLWDDFQIQPGNGFPTHPHRGFEAITYIFHGSIRHQDNLGNASTVTDGGAQRFTAGRGMEHSEMPSQEGITRGIQLWINLPRRLKALAPAYQQVDAPQFPQYVIENSTVREIVGERSPLQLHTSVRYLDVRLPQQGIFRQDMPVDYRGLVYVVEGQVLVDGEVLRAGATALYEAPAILHIEAPSPARIMVCFGRPHGEPIRQYGPFVD